MGEALGGTARLLRPDTPAQVLKAELAHIMATLSREMSFTGSGTFFRFNALSMKQSSISSTSYLSFFS
ncbi:hypothetical protein U4M36_26195 [Klebsiella pneumoniae]|nr:hypothetical protein [Klebsiella pneumoniae]